LVWQKQREERDRQEKLRKAYEEKQQKDLAEFKEMLLKASRWHKAVNVRNYIDAVEYRAITSNHLSDELKDWLIWARKKADWYDPFIESEDELLNEVDRESLTMARKNSFVGW
jgi:intergrase/recombinase